MNYNFKKIIFSCSTSEKLEIIPEGELKPKAQIINEQNRTSSIRNNKRISNAEISSTTVNAVNIFCFSCFFFNLKF